MNIVRHVKRLESFSGEQTGQAGRVHLSTIPMVLPLKCETMNMVSLDTYTF
jgi:hypothetical protein